MAGRVSSNWVRPNQVFGFEGRREFTMKNLTRGLLTASAVLVLAGIGLADTLELKDGRVLQGKYLGGTQAVLRFEVNGEVQTFPTHDIVALTFTRGSGGAAPAAAPPAENQAPPPAVANSYAGGDVNLPAGQS